MEEEFTITKKPSKLWLFLLDGGVLFIIGASVLFVLAITKPKIEQDALVFPELPSEKPADTKIYSTLTGLEISNAAENNAPIYCIQTPNGLDGARPQAGLDEAKVVFEAIAEAGITRFAAIYQNPQSAVIGPLRSLRLYYLEWDTPFDCTITHAGGAYDAIQAVNAGGYKDLTENYAYMYRGTVASRLWNNLFTNGNHLNQFANDYGYHSSNPTGFTRFTPEEARINRINIIANNKLNILQPSTNGTMSLDPEINNITFNFGGWSEFNPSYHYDVNSNTYKRSYQSGDSHDVYSCPKEDLGEKNPESICELRQLSPSVVIGIVVQEKKSWDNYHEDITTLGSGDAYIFQNGTVITGKWQKNTREEQIKFYDQGGNEIKLVPGQTWISAIPQYGSVDYSK